MEQDGDSISVLRSFEGGQNGQILDRYFMERYVLWIREDYWHNVTGGGTFAGVVVLKL